MLTSAIIPRWRDWSTDCRGRVAIITSSVSSSTSSLPPFPELEGGCPLWKIKGRQESNLKIRILFYPLIPLLFTDSHRTAGVCLVLLGKR